MTRVALFSDAGVARLPFFDTARRSLASAGLDVVTYTDVRVEPTDVSFQDAARFAAEAKPDGYVSVGGGSVIDTAKAANLYATHPADFLAYVNKPVGEGEPVPGPLTPHIACPTTSGTGSEVTGMAIFDLLAMEAKTGIASPALRPDRSAHRSRLHRQLARRGGRVQRARCVVPRPGVVHGAPPHAPRRVGSTEPAAHEPGCESVERSRLPRSAPTARRPSRARGQRCRPTARRASRRCGRPPLPASRSAMPAYTSRTRWRTRSPARYGDFHPAGYPGPESLVPHGMAVIVNAPSVFRAIALDKPGAPSGGRPPARR